MNYKGISAGNTISYRSKQGARQLGLVQSIYMRNGQPTAIVRVLDQFKNATDLTEVITFQNNEIVRI